MPVYLTLEQVCARVHAPLETVKYWIYSGKLNAYKPGRHPLVREDELAAFVESRSRRVVQAEKARRVRKGAA